jgi:hypothetical protein
MGKIWTENDLERSMSRAGNYFLSPSTKSFFKSRVLNIFPLGETLTVFTTSDKSPSGRVCSTHLWDSERNEVETIFKHGTSRGAKKAFDEAIRRLREGEL